MCLLLKKKSDFSRKKRTIKVCSSSSYPQKKNKAHAAAVLTSCIIEVADFSLQ